LDVEGLRKDAESMGVKVKESKAWAELKAVVLGDGEYKAFFRTFTCTSRFADCL